MKRMIFILSAVAMLLGGIGCESERTLSWSWGTAVLDEKIVTVGGTFWVEREGEKDLKIWENRVDLLNTKTMAWEELPRYPKPAGYPFATFIGSKLYVIGGRGAEKGNSETFINGHGWKRSQMGARAVSAQTTMGDGRSDNRRRYLYCRWRGGRPLEGRRGEACTQHSRARHQES